MRRLRRGLAPSDIFRLFFCLAALGGAGVLGGCAGGADRVYGFQAYEAQAAMDVDGTPSRLSTPQAEALIAQAILAHEMRRP